MLIVVPSKGRAEWEKQVTLRALSRLNAGGRTVLLVVPADEAPRYEAQRKSRRVEVVPAPGDARGISATRAWILGDLAHQRGECRVLMVDDDMDFCWRPDMEDEKLLMIEDPNMFEDMLATLEGWLKEGFAHVGVSARQNNHTFPQPSGSDHDARTGKPREYRDATRMMNMYAYDTQILRKLKIELGRLQVMEDFDLTLQLLRRGYPNRVSYRYCWNQRGSGKVGGCSDYRTAEMQADAARRLAELHAPFVTLKTKKSKDTSDSWQGMKERTDVNIQWREAYESSGKTVDPGMKKTRRVS